METSLPIKHYAVLDSTNDEAKRLGLSGECGPLWICAARQTHGRGRRARQWQSPAGNLACTGLYHGHGALTQSAQLGFAAALAVAETLGKWVDPAEELTIKWPNDVLLGGAKIAGILLESGASPRGGHWLAVGIGINLASAPQDLPYKATCLAERLPPNRQLPQSEAVLPAPQAVLEALITAFEKSRTCLEQEGFAPIRLAWLARAHGLGKPINTSGGVQGVFEDLSKDGAIVLRQHHGRSIEISAGEVFFVHEES